MDRTLATHTRSYAPLQRRSGLRHLVVHDQTLGREAPELVAAVERRHEFGRLRLGEGFDGAFWTILPHDAVDATVALVTQVVLGHVGSATPRGGLHAGGIGVGRRIVLDDKAVEINHPDRAVRTDIGEDW